MPQLVQLIVIAAPLLLGNVPQSRPLDVAGITVDGARRYKPAEVIRSSGLKPAGRITTTELATALKRMAATGLYKSVNYRTVANGRRTTIVLEIEEADWTIPVEFDNFGAFTDEELKQTLRVRLFSFDGMVPPSPGIPELIVSELQKLRQAKGLPGDVEFYPRTNDKLQISAYVFRVKE